MSTPETLSAVAAAFAERWGYSLDELAAAFQTDLSPAGFEDSSDVFGVFDSGPALHAAAERLGIDTKTADGYNRYAQLKGLGMELRRVRDAGAPGD